MESAAWQNAMKTQNLPNHHLLWTQAEKEQSPEEQRERLLESVKIDNQEIAGIAHKNEQVRWFEFVE